MMISPEGYYNSYLKNKSADEILNIIYDLENEIQELEKCSEEQCIIRPLPETRASCNKEYLKRAIQTLSELGVEYTSKFVSQTNKYYLEYPADIFILSENYYEAKINDITFKIDEENFNDETVAYAYKISELYEIKKEKISKFVLHRIGDFYSFGYTPEEIKEKLGEPYIEILDKDYGVIVWLESTLDEHIIDCEFGKDDMTLYHVGVNG